MRIEELLKDYKRVEFSKMKIKATPRQSGVYLLTSYFDLVLYIGVSNNLQRRLYQHLQNPEKLDLTPMGRAFWFYYRLCSEKESRPIEHALILQYQLKEATLPYFNKIEAPCF